MAHPAWFLLAVLFATMAPVVFGIGAALVGLQPCTANIQSSVRGYCAMLREVFVRFWMLIFSWAYRSLLRSVEG